ncbi:hypothetical protein ABPG75_003559 [Micractinium tetrahymenae]
MIKLLLQHGADVHQRDERENTPLITAAGGGHTTAVAALLQAGSDVEAADVDKFTALLTAAQNRTPGQLATLEKLLVAGRAKLDEKNRVGQTALHVAAFAGHARAAQLLVRLGADIHARDDWLRPPVAGQHLRASCCGANAAGCRR